jgi:small-conductance mechanosensitive channel
MSARARLAPACVLALLSLFRPALAAEPQGAFAAAESRQATEAEARLAPVELDGRTLFKVRGASSLPAEQRAAAIAARIRDLAEDASLDPADLKATQLDGGGRIETADGRLVMNVYDADSISEGFSREGVMTALLMQTRRAIVDYRADRTPEAMTSAWLHALGALAVLALVLFLVLRGSRRIEAALERRYGHHVPRIGIGSFEIVRAERVWNALHALTGLLRWALSLLLVFLGLRYVLALFPQTRGLANHMAELVADPLKHLAFGALALVPDLIFLIILFFVARWFIRLTQLFFQAVEKGHIELKDFDPAWAMPTFRLVRLGIVALAVVVAYPYIPGADSAAFKGVTLFLGVLVSIGSSSAISNIIAGYMLTYRRAFHVGDRVRIDDVTGDVTAMRMQVTHIRTVKNESVTIPNSMILGSQVVNYSTLAASEGVIVSVTAGIGYETPWRQVEAMLKEAAARTPGIKPEPPPFVQQLALGDFAVTYELNVYCDTPQRMVSLRTALHTHVLDVFNEYGVQIMTPAYEGDPAQPKLVPREQWFTPPAKRPEGGPARAGS